MRTPFYKNRADTASHYRRDGDFVQITAVHPDDLLGPTYDVVRDADATVIRGVRGPKGTRFAEGNTVFMRYMGGSHYYTQLEGVSGGSAHVSILSSGTGDTTNPDLDNYVLRSGNTLSGMLESEDSTLELDFVDGLLVFRQTAGVSEQGGDLELSSAVAGQWGLSELAHHKARHENGGGDEISVAGLGGLLADAQTPLAHNTTHQEGGSDEINVGGLAGLLADPQTPLGHHLTHENGGEDEISIGGLSGELADPQTPKTHAASHQEGGPDEISLSGLSGLAAEAQQIAVRRNWEGNIGSRPRLHLSEGENISLSLADNENDDEIIVLISAEAAQAVPGGSDGQMQFNDNGSFGGNESFLFDDTAGAMQLSAKNAEAVPLRVKLAASATGDGFELLDSSDNVLAQITKEGGLRITTGANVVPLALYGSNSSGGDAIAQIIANNDALACAPIFLGYKSRGSYASPTALQTDDYLILTRGVGYGATAYKIGGEIQLRAAQTFTDSAAGSYWELRNCPNGSTTRATNLTIGQDGNITAPAIYANNVGVGQRDVFVTSAGLLGYYSSSAKYKENIEPVDDSDVSWLYSLNPRKYDRKDGSVTGEIGLIAEEVAAVEGIPAYLVSYKRIETTKDPENGPRTFIDSDEPETVNFSQLIIPLLQAVRDLKAENDALAARLLALENTK